MPLIRKVSRTGNSYTVTLPKSWVFYWKKDRPIKAVEMEVNEELKIKPVLEE